MIGDVDIGVANIPCSGRAHINGVIHFAVCRSQDLIPKRVRSIAIFLGIPLHLSEVVIPCVYFMNDTE